MGDRRYHHGDLRQTLIDLATDEIAGAGVDALSLRALARSAGVAHRAAYQHFPDKEALVAAVLAAGYERLGGRFKDAVDRKAPPDRQLVSVAEAYAAFAFAEPNVFLAMTGPRLNASGAHPSLEKALGDAWRYIVEPINEGVESGLFGVGDSVAACAIFWGGLQGVIVQAVLGRLKVSLRERRTFFRLVALRLLEGLKPASLD